MKQSLLLPSRCIFCGHVMPEPKLVCKYCVAEKPFIVGKVCRFCGLEKSKCTCGNRKHNYIRRIACVYYHGSVTRGVSRFKFYRRTMLARYYAQLMVQNIASKYKDIAFDMMIPVPMHPFDMWRRGFNCSNLLCEHIAEELPIPLVDDLLIKSRRHRPQKRCPLSKRAANVLDSFAVTDADRIAGKTILLIDDVCTTGATLNECAKMLKLHGAKVVYAATFAAVALNY